jgi:predicted TIM-barrel fold metal-dependent hydrolase
MADAESIQGVDAFVNPVVWSTEEAPPYVREAMREVFHTDLDAQRPRSPEELIAEMDAGGVSHAVINAVGNYWDEAYAFVEAQPSRFAFSVELDPRTGMDAVRAVERAVRDYGAILIRMVPFVVGLPPSDRVYFPVFAKCIELGVPVGINTGIPGPRMPAAPQQPLHLDEVALFFPELTIVMQHGADPWWGEAMRLLLKYPKMYMMTSAWSPKYLPEEFVRFMASRGRGKVMFASDFPAIPIQRCAKEARQLNMPIEALESYLSGTARSLWPQLGP